MGLNPPVHKQQKRNDNIAHHRSLHLVRCSNFAGRPYKRKKQQEGSEDDLQNHRTCHYRLDSY